MAALATEPSNKLLERGVCHFSIIITPPEGHYHLNWTPRIDVHDYAKGQRRNM